MFPAFSVSFYLYHDSHFTLPSCFCFGCMTWGYLSSMTMDGTQAPWLWKHRVPNTRPPGRSLPFCLEWTALSKGKICWVIISIMEYLLKYITRGDKLSVARKLQGAGAWPENPGYRLMRPET